MADPWTEYAPVEDGAPWEDYAGSDLSKGIGVVHQAIGDVMGSITSPAAGEASAIGRRKLELGREKEALQREVSPLGAISAVEAGTQAVAGIDNLAV
jgi:hypothetical protein